MCEKSNLQFLYQWKILAEDKQAKDDACFFETEKVLYEIGIRTRVEKRVDEDGKGDGEGYLLLVPLKDFEVAYALYSGEVKRVITEPKETYHVFEDDLSYKNKNLYRNRYENLVCKRNSRRYLYLGIAIAIMLFLLKTMSHFFI